MHHGIAAAHRALEYLVLGKDEKQRWLWEHRLSVDKWRDQFAQPRFTGEWVSAADVARVFGARRKAVNKVVLHGRLGEYRRSGLRVPAEVRAEVVNDCIEKVEFCVPVPAIHDLLKRSAENSSAEKWYLGPVGFDARYRSLYREIPVTQTRYLHFKEVNGIFRELRDVRERIDTWQPEQAIYDILRIEPSPRDRIALRQQLRDHGVTVEEVPVLVHGHLSGVKQYKLPKEEFAEAVAYVDSTRKLEAAAAGVTPAQPVEKPCLDGLSRVERFRTRYGGSTGQLPVNLLNQN